MERKISINLKKNPKQTPHQNHNRTPQPKQEATERPQRLCPSRPTRAAGLSFNTPFMWAPTYKKDILAAEIFRNSHDPQHSTDVQKTWVLGGDPGLRMKRRTIKCELPPVDNENSLPLGEGAYVKRAKSEKPGGNRRIRTDVTMATKMHHKIGLR